MEKIRIGQKNIKKIEVNDNGDYIVLNFNDRSFIKKFMGLIDFFDEKSSVLEKEEEEIRKLPNEKQEGEFVSKRERAIIEFDTKVHEMLRDRVDDVFGNDTCKKVFGENVVPSIFAYGEFFNAIIPFFTEYADLQKSKYSAMRTGNV